MPGYTEILIPVVEDHELSIAAKPTGKAHLACGHRLDGRPEWRVELHTASEGLGLELGVDHAPERRGDRSFDGRREPLAEAREGRTQRLGPARWRLAK